MRYKVKVIDPQGSGFSGLRIARVHSSGLSTPVTVLYLRAAETNAHSLNRMAHEIARTLNARGLGEALYRTGALRERLIMAHGQLAANWDIMRWLLEAIGWLNNAGDIHGD